MGGVNFVVTRWQRKERSIESNRGQYSNVGGSGNLVGDTNTPAAAAVEGERWSKYLWRNGHNKFGGSGQILRDIHTQTITSHHPHTNSIRSLTHTKRERKKNEKK